eukprot:scaffold89246_cov17-Tisochrysis_lutea.AAC.1
MKAGKGCLAVEGQQRQGEGLRATRLLSPRPEGKGSSMHTSGRCKQIWFCQAALLAYKGREQLASPLPRQCTKVKSSISVGEV